MKTLYLFLIAFILLLTGNVYAQSKFGNATIDELQMNVYEPDTAAVALVLNKSGETRFVYDERKGFQFEYTLQAKIKILSSEGLDFCNQSISYFYENSLNGEKITTLNGTTYNLENGKVVKVKLSKDFITEENVDGKWRLRKFTMPGAKVGSVIEYKYTLVSDYFYDLRDFEFQSSAPTLYASYEVVIPEYFRYNPKMQGYENIKVERTPVNETIHVAGVGRINCTAQKHLFVGRNLSGLKKEPFMWTLEDYISKVSFELREISYPWSTTKNYSSTWKNIDEELLKSSDFGGNLKKEGLFKNELGKGELSLEKAREIERRIKTKVSWNDKNKLLPTNLKDVLKEGVGNSSDMNFLLINALKAAGFEAYPVVLSTRSNGRLPIAVPSITELNYTIAALKLDTTYYFTDASAKYGEWNVLPEKCMVEQARIIKPSMSEWVDLSALAISLSLINATINIDESGIISKVKEITRGNFTYDYKSDFYGSKDEQDFIEKLGNKLSGTINDFKLIENGQKLGELSVEYTLRKDLNMGDEFIYLSPLIVNPISENPFKREERKFPINFDYLSNYKQIININIPQGYIVEELPESEKFILGENNDIVFNYRIVKNDTNILLQYQININNLLILPAEYAHLRELMSKIVMKNSEQIVLKKIAL